MLGKLLEQSQLQLAPILLIFNQLHTVLLVVSNSAFLLYFKNHRGFFVATLIPITHCNLKTCKIRTGYLHTANVLSAEFTGKCLRTKSKDN